MPKYLGPITQISEETGLVELVEFSLVIII